MILSWRHMMYMSPNLCQPTPNMAGKHWTSQTSMTLNITWGRWLFTFMNNLHDICNQQTKTPWWRQQMETFFALLAICAGNSAQRPVTRSFDILFDLRLNQRLSKQSWGWWFETLPRPLWRHCNDKMRTSELAELNTGIGDPSGNDEKVRRQVKNNKMSNVTVFQLSIVPFGPVVAHSVLI